MLSNGVSVERFVKAPAERVFALLADPSRHREIDGSGTLRDAKGGSTRLALGSRFGMNMKAGAPYVMVNEVVEFEADRRIAWQARPRRPSGAASGATSWSRATAGRWCVRPGTSARSGSRRWCGDCAA